MRAHPGLPGTRRPVHRDEFDAEARRPSIPVIILLSLLAILGAFALVGALGAILHE